MSEQNKNLENEKPEKQEHKKCDKHQKNANEKQCECKEKCECENKEDLSYQTNLEDKVLEYIQTAQRLQADFDNYRKRAQEQISLSRFDGMIDAIKEFLPALDSLANAKKMITDEKLLEGFVMIENQILNAFTKLGVEKIKTDNQPFDPQLHNALAMQTNADIADNIIVSEYQAGYKLKDKIIRYSQVIVNKKEEE